jgi:peptide/nickel transport system substrate-binding protein
MSKQKNPQGAGGMTRRHFLQAGAMGTMALAMPKVVWSGGRKILKVRDYSPVETFDPAIHSGVPEEGANHAIYNKLVSYRPGDEWGWRLEAAKSIDQVDATHIKFELKPGIQFTDNYGEMTAEDVKFSMERHLDPDLKSQLRGDLGTFDHVETNGKYGGVIVLKESFQPLWMTGLAYMAGNIISKKATLEKGGTFTQPPCCSGPYKFKSWKPKQGTVLVRNDLWNGKPADFDEIHIMVIDDEKTAEIGFEAGDIDFTRISMSSLGNYLATPQPNSTLVTKPSLYYVWLGMNVENEILKNKAVRKAVQYAVDVDAVLEAAYFGAAKRATGILPPGLIGHREANRIAKPDPARAKKLLAEAGYGSGLELTLDVLNKTTFITAAQVIQASLAQAGITLTINVHDSGTFWSLGDVSKGDDWKRLQLVMNRFSSAPDPYYATQWFTKEQIGTWNWEHFNDPEYNRLHKAAATETDTAKRDAMYRKMMNIMEESGAYLFLTHESVPLLYRNTVVPALRPDGVPMWRYFRSA